MLEISQCMSRWYTILIVPYLQTWAFQWFFVLVHMYTYIYTHTYIYICIYMYTHTYMHIYAHINMCELTMYVHIYVYMYLYSSWNIIFWKYRYLCQGKIHCILPYIHTNAYMCNFSTYHSCKNIAMYVKVIFTTFFHVCIQKHTYETFQDIVTVKISLGMSK